MPCSDDDARHARRDHPGHGTPLAFFLLLSDRRRPPTTMSLTASVTEQAKDTVENLADDDADSTNSEVRYMAYGARIRTALRAAQRYIAYVRAIPQCVLHAFLIRYFLCLMIRRVMLERHSVLS